MFVRRRFHRRLFDFLISAKNERAKTKSDTSLWIPETPKSHFGFKKVKGDENFFVITM